MPFPNMAMLATATKTCAKVQIEFMDVVVETSEMPSSQGDEAGVAGGVVSNTFAQKVVFKLGSTTVKAAGKGLAYQSALTAHNGSNPNMPAGLHTAPSQGKVSVMP